jgi:short-subunit dehydrogenase
MNAQKARPLAVVTGASSGIGRAFAIKLAGEGHDLMLVARRQDELASLAIELRQLGADVQCLAVDLTQPGSIDTIAAALGQRDVALLVNNAGFGLFGLFADTDGARELAMIDLNVRVPTELAKRLLPGLIRARGGIINVASTAAFQPGPWMAVYYATKAYVLSFSEAIAEELAPRGVRVMALCPGPIRSGFQDAATMQRSGLLRMPLPSAEWAVDSAWRAWRRGRRVHVPGWINKLMAFSVRLTPRRWMTAMVRVISAPI